MDWTDELVRVLAPYLRDKGIPDSEHRANVLQAGGGLNDGRRRVRRLRIPTPLVGLLVTRLGSRRQNAATAGTTGCAPASRRAYDWQPQGRLRSAVSRLGTTKMRSSRSISTIVCSTPIPVYNKPIEQPVDVTAMGRL